MSDARIIELNKRETELKQKLAELIALEKSVIKKIFELRKRPITQGVSEEEKDSLAELIGQYNKADFTLCASTGGMPVVQRIPTVQTVRFATDKRVNSPWVQRLGDEPLTQEGFSKVLEESRIIIEACIDILNPIKTQKQALLARLKAYTDRIESHTNNGSIDFGYGFSPFLFFMNSSRAKNRKANYALAKYLQADITINLDNNNDLAMKKFVDADLVRNAFISSEDSRGINSDELKGIIAAGKLEPRWR